MLTNALMSPKVYFGLHMEEGVAEYRPKGQDPFRVLVPQKIANALNPTFQGRPLYALHNDQDDSERDPTKADGYVVRSFFNPADGKHWAEFLVVSEKGHEAIAKGWRLSNAYVPQLTERKGLWHGVEYQKEVMGGTFDHMALVPNPRYENSIVLTPEEFRKYNEEKEAELKRLSNSQDDEKKETQGMLSFFKKQKIENSADLEGTSVMLPKSKREVTITQLVNEADEIALAAGKPRVANELDLVEVGSEKMTVKDVLAKLQALIAECAEAKDESVENEEADEKDESSTEGEQGDAVENEKDEAKEKVEEKQKKDKMENAADDAAAKAAKKANFDKLKNARDTSEERVAKVDLSVDQVARGKQRYGSN